MQSLLQIVNEWITPKGLAVTTSVLFFLALSKIYFNGGVCRVNRNLTGKVIVVTGGNTGIGKATIEELAKQDCIIIFGARDQRKSQQALNDIKSRNREANIMYFPLNLASKASISEFSKRVNEHCEKIDILINNAGLMAIPQRQLTVDGFEMQMGVNHLGHFYLTYLLWEKIKKAKKPRIINVSSKAHQGFFTALKTMDFEDLGSERDYAPTLAYARSKAANILFTKELQRKMDQENFEGYTYSLHPGGVRTQLPRYVPFPLSALKIPLAPVLYFLLKSPHQGAQTTLYTVLQDETKLTKGAYFSDCKQTELTSFTKNPQNAQKLWKASEKLLDIEFKI